MRLGREARVAVCCIEGCSGLPLWPDVICNRCHDQEQRGALDAEAQLRAFERRAALVRAGLLYGRFLR